MNYAKLFRPSNGIQKPCAQSHGISYCCTLDHIISMAKELMRDFKEVSISDIQVQKYGGQRIKGITFVEVFLPHETEMPEGYTEIEEIEYIQ